MLTEQGIVIPLSGWHFAAGPIEFLRVESSSYPTPFARIRYGLNGEEQPFGLRLDLDKGIVLLDEGDPEIVKKAVLAYPQHGWKTATAEGDVRAVQEMILQTIAIARTEISKERRRLWALENNEEPLVAHL